MPRRRLLRAGTRPRHGDRDRARRVALARASRSLRSDRVRGVAGRLSPVDQAAPRGRYAAARRRRVSGRSAGARIVRRRRPSDRHRGPRARRRPRRSSRKPDEIRSASSIPALCVIRNLVLEGNNVPVDGVKAEGHARWAHHITLENLVIRGHGNNQQTVGISTKCPAWNWVIRGVTIIGAGTGIYLGNSDGSAPFVAGLIERNLIVDSIGYNLQIKHQVARPDLPGHAGGQSTTIIRHNVFAKPERGLARGGAAQCARRPFSARGSRRRGHLRGLRQFLLPESARGAVPGRRQRRPLRQRVRERLRRRRADSAAQRRPAPHRDRFQYRAGPRTPALS